MHLVFAIQDFSSRQFYDVYAGFGILPVHIYHLWPFYEHECAAVYNFRPYFHDGAHIGAGVPDAV